MNADRYLSIITCSAVSTYSMDVIKSVWAVGPLVNRIWGNLMSFRENVKSSEVEPVKERLEESRGKSPSRVGLPVRYRNAFDVLLHHNW